MGMHDDTKSQLLPSEDKPFHELTFDEKADTAKEMIKAAIPNIFASVGLQLKDVISMYFVGHLSNPLLLAAFGFGITWANGFAIAIIFGFAAGFGTLAAQANGAKNYQRLGLLYQKIMVVVGLTLILMCGFLWITGDVLRAMSYEEDLAREVNTFCRTLIPNIIIYSLFEITKFYLLAQNVYDIPAYIVTTTSIVHIFWCYLLTSVFELDLVGIGIARTITDGTSTILILLYVKFRNPHPQTWIPWQPECLEGLWTFTKDILSHGSSVYIEWITFEITTLVTGYFRDVNVLAAHTSTLNFMFLNFTLTFGLTLAMSTMVGNAAGEGAVHKVKRYGYIGLTLIFSILAILDLSMLLLRHKIAAFYTDDAEVQNIIAMMLLIYFFGMPFDIGSNTLGYLLRAVGQDRYVLKTYFVSYYLVGMTAGITFGLYLGYGFYGVWCGLVSGFWVMVALNVYKLYCINWKEEVYKIMEIMKSHTATGDTEEMEMVNY